MSEANKYYVYACYVDDELKYVGMGQGLRYRHCNSGSSSCAELNKDFYEGKKIEVKKLHKNLTKLQADEIEEALIRDNFDHLYNKVVKYLPPSSKPNISMKRGYKILAGTWSLGEQKKYFDDFMLSKGLDSDDIGRIQDPLIQIGMCLYIVKDGTSSPMIVVDKMKESDVDKWHAEVFAHLAHPDGLYNWQVGLNMATGCH